MDDLIKEIEIELELIQSDFKNHNAISKNQTEYLMDRCKFLIDSIKWEIANCKRLELKLKDKK